MNKDNGEKILKAIKDIPICTKGQDGIKNLLKEMGYKLEEKLGDIMVRQGDKFKFGMDRYIVILYNNEVALISIDKGWSKGGWAPCPARLSDITNEPDNAVKVEKW